MTNRGEVQPVLLVARSEQTQKNRLTGMPNGSSALFMQIQAAAKKEWLIALIRDSGGNVVELTLDVTAEVEIEEQLAG